MVGFRDVWPPSFDGLGSSGLDCNRAFQDHRTRGLSWFLLGFSFFLFLLFVFGEFPPPTGPVFRGGLMD